MGPVAVQRLLGEADMKVRLAGSRRYYYPDLVVGCSDPADEPDDYTETRPVLLVEILSDSIEQTDRREKLVAYRSIPSLVDYLIVAQAERFVERFSRVAHPIELDAWTHSTFATGDWIALDSIGFALGVDDLYSGVLG